MVGKSGIAALAALLLCVCASAAQAGSWRILKDHWSKEDEAGFGRFVTAIGESDCSSSESCLRDPANPYRKTDQHFVDIDVDCAKWPYLLRAYYAWKNSLPFSYVDSVSGEGGDLRFSKTANRPTGRKPSASSSIPYSLPLIGLMRPRHAARCRTSIRRR